MADMTLFRAAFAAPGKVRPLRPPQLVEIAIPEFGVLARKPGCSGQSTSPDRGIRWHPRKPSETASFYRAITIQAERPPARRYGRWRAQIHRFRGRDVVKNRQHRARYATGDGQVRICLLPDAGRSAQFTCR